MTYVASPMAWLGPSAQQALSLPPPGRGSDGLCALGPDARPTVAGCSAREEGSVARKLRGRRRASTSPAASVHVGRAELGPGLAAASWGQSCAASGRRSSVRPSSVLAEVAGAGRGRAAEPALWKLERPHVLVQFCVLLLKPR